jgi:nicotinic acetylcholine receptor
MGMDLEDYYPSVEWDILSVPAERHEKYYPCCAGILICSTLRLIN